MNSLPIQHVAPTPKKSNKIWIIVVVLLILCCLCSLIGGVAGYFYFQNNNSGIGEIFDIVQTPQSNEVNTGEEIRSEEGGYAFKTIPGYKASPGWVVSGGYTLDSKDIDFTDPNFVIGEGPQIILSGYVPSSDLSFEKYVENGKSDWSIRLQATTSGEPQVSVAGLKGIAYDYDYELTGAGKMKARDISVEVNPKQFFTIICRSTVEKWDKTLADCDAVINSITFLSQYPLQPKHLRLLDLNIEELLLVKIDFNNEFKQTPSWSENKC